MNNIGLEKVLLDTNIDWKEFGNATILVTGATGLIGSLLVKSLLAYKYQNSTNTKIFAFVRNEEKAKAMFNNDNLRFVIGDIATPINIEESIDYIFHCASVTTSKYMVTNPVETLHTSIAGTKSILELAKKHNIKSMVYVSSMEVYGSTNDSDNPITEKKLGHIDLTNVRSSYSEGKRICELMCKSYQSEYGINVKTARLAMTFGPGVPTTDNRMPMQFAKSVINSENIVLHTKGDSISNFCYTTDAVRGLFTVLLKGKPGNAYNVCNDYETRAVKDIANLVAHEVANDKIKVVFDIPESNVFGFAPKTEMRLNSDKLRSLGWKANIDMKTAFRNLIDYLR